MTRRASLLQESTDHFMEKANNLIVSLILGVAVLVLPVTARAAGAAQIEQSVQTAAQTTLRQQS